MTQETIPSSAPQIINLMLSNEQNHNHTFLRTAVTGINDTTIKIVLDNGCDATMVTKSLLRKIGLTPKTDDKVLRITTMNGQNKITSKSVTINFKNVAIKAFVLESNLRVGPQNFNLNEIWPSQDKKLAKEVKRNIVNGQIDVIVGLDEL